MRDGGAQAKSIIAQARNTAAELGKDSNADLKVIGQRLIEACTALEQVVDFIAAHGKSDIKAAFAGSVPYLKLAGVVFGGWQMARAALAAKRLLAAPGADVAFCEAKIVSARFYANHVLSQAGGLRDAVLHGSPGVLALSEEQF